MGAESQVVRAGCYCRISSDPREKREGVDRQREDTADTCEVEGWTVADFYVDNDVSASDGRTRPEWDRLLADVRRGKIDAIVVWNQDRGWRKMADLESLRPVLEPRNVLLATTNIGVLNFGNPDDVFKAQISTAMSEMEIAKMRVRMLRAAKQRAERGIPKWRKAFGYTTDGTYQLDPVTAPLVAEAYRTVLAGGSIADVARAWNAAGALGLNGRPWTPSNVSMFLRKPRNAGLREHRGEIVGKGTWPPLVDEDTWRATQSVLNAPGRAPGRKTVRRHLLTGVLLCGKPGCGGYLSGRTVLSTDSPTSSAIAYRCKTCMGVSVHAERIEPLVYRVVIGRLARPDAVDLLKAEVHDEVEAEAIRTELNTLHAELRNIGVERGKRLLTGEQAKVASDLINEDIAVLERRQQDAERLRVFDGIPLGTPEVAAAIRRLSPDRFRAVLDVLVEFTVLPVGKGRHVFTPDRVVTVWKVV